MEVTENDNPTVICRLHDICGGWMQRTLLSAPFGQIIGRPVALNVICAPV